MFDMLNAWHTEAGKFENSKITKAEYDEWRYNYPRVKVERLKTELDALRAESNKNEDK